MSLYYKSTLVHKMACRLSSTDQAASYQFCESRYIVNRFQYNADAVLGPKLCSIYLVQRTKSGPSFKIIRKFNCRGEISLVDISPSKGCSFHSSESYQRVSKVLTRIFDIHALNKMSISSPWPINSLILNIIPLLVRLYLNIVVNLWPQLCYIRSYC